MDAQTAGRVLIGDSLAFHIIFVLLSIGLPFLLNIFEWYAWRRNNDKIKGFVRLLSRWAGVFVIAGIMSGTVIALQFSTLWAPFLNVARPHVGSLFMLEGYMFLVEAVFLSWYFLTMKQVGTFRHWLIGLPITFGVIGSAFFITAVDAWMNNPSSVFTSTTFFEVTHSVTSYFFATTVLVLGYVAWRSLRGKKNEFTQWLIGRLALIATVLIVALAFLGHQSAVDIASTQPQKLAAMEILDKTGSNAPLRIGGEINSDGVATGGIVLPGMLSLLAGYSPDYSVKGLDQISRDKWPMLVVHSLFDVKMILVAVSGLLVVLAAIYYWRIKRQPKWLAGLLAMFGLIGIVMVELGWMITELGRQPYAINGQLLTKDAFVSSGNLFGTGFIFPVLYIILGLAVLSALAITTKDWRKKEKTSW